MNFFRAATTLKPVIFLLMLGYYEQIWRFSLIDPEKRSKFVDLNGLWRLAENVSQTPKMDKFSNL